MTVTSPAAARLADAARSFSGRRLTVARQLAGLRRDALAERIGETLTAVAGYETGTVLPTPATVARLAMSLTVEPAFFTGTDAPAAVPHFRSLRSTTQLVRDQAHAYGCLVAAVAAALERYVELPRPDVPRWPVPTDGMAPGAAEAAAAHVRAAWGMGRGPVGHLIRLLENRGVVVVFSLPRTAAVDTFSIEPGTRPIVLLNPVRDDRYRQRFDVAHELGHLVMHADAEPGDRLAEGQAGRFAAEFLMPADAIADELPTRVDWPRLFAVKQRWGVSLQALLARCRQLRTMSEPTYRRAMVALSSHGWRRQEPGEQITAELPSLLPRSVELLENAGYSARTLAAEARVPVPVFEAATAGRAKPA